MIQETGDPGAGEPPGVPEVLAVDETALSGLLDASDTPIDTTRWANLAAAVLQAEGVNRGELGLRFVAVEDMAELNSVHLGESGPTDVLAFPIDARQPDAVQPEADDSSTNQSFEPEMLLGDVVICPAYARKSLQKTDDLCDELALLVVHGVLHVLGYDHAHVDDAAVMQARQDQLLAEHHRAGFTSSARLLAVNG